MHENEGERTAKIFALQATKIRDKLVLSNLQQLVGNVEMNITV